MPPETTVPTQSIDQLLEHITECTFMIQQVRDFSAQTGSIRLNELQALTHRARLLHTRILSSLHAGGPAFTALVPLIEGIEMIESYQADSMLLRWGDRPSVNALDAVQHILENALGSVADSSASIVVPPRVSSKRRGPEPDTAKHQRVADIVMPFQPDWKEPLKLAKICAQLDAAGIPVPPSWKKATVRRRKFTTALEHKKNDVVRWITHRLDMVGRVTKSPTLP
jgi:hypothetical protein